jgi:hypothetical protein
MRFALAMSAFLIGAGTLAQGPAPVAERQPAAARKSAPSTGYDAKVANARALLKANDARASLAASREAIALDDSRWEAYVTAAGAYSSQSLYDDAIGMLQTALTRAPEDRKPSIRDALAETRRALSAAASQPTAPNAASAASAPTQQEVVLWKSIENSKNPADFQGYLDAYPHGIYAPLARRHLSTLGSAESAPPSQADAKGRPDLVLADLTDERKKQLGLRNGVLVEDASPTSGGKLEAGDVIVAMVRSGEMIEAKSAKELNGQIALVAKGASVTFLVRRGDRQFYMTMHVGAQSSSGLSKDDPFYEFFRRFATPGTSGASQ